MMNSHEALIDYGRPVVEGDSSIRLDLFPAIPSPLGAVHHALVKHFDMVESNEVPHLMTLLAKCEQVDFLDFFGHSWDEALARWEALAFCHEYRQKNGREFYMNLESWELYYRLVAEGIEPASIRVKFIEHY